MKRFLLFSGWTYYPGGGWDDFVNSFDTLKEAIATAEEEDKQNDWHQIVDKEEGMVIWPIL